MYYRQQTITPEVAKELLKLNERNRTLKRNKLRQYVEDMRNGNWTESPDPICITTERKLSNGQHRLNAIIKANVAVVMTVAYDVPPDAVIDKGTERTTGDSLYMRGLIPKEMSTTFVTAVVNRYLAISVVDGGNLTDTYKANFINENQNAISTAIEISRIGSSSERICYRAGVQAAILGALLCGVDEQRLRTFARIANTGFMENNNQSAAIVLRNYIMRNPSVGASAANDQAAVAQMAIRDFISGNPRRRSYINADHIYIRHAA